MSQRLSLKKIRTDGGTQPRAALDQARIAEYADDMKRGDEFPPVTVFYDGADYWLADGFHRYHARTANHPDIEVEVRQGTRRDAILHSVGANASHGMRRTNEDKRRAVLTLLGDPEWSQWSDREIARLCAVSDRFVNGLRPQAPSANGSQIERPRTVSRGGRTYTMKTVGLKRKATLETSDKKKLPKNEAEPEQTTVTQQPARNLGVPTDRVVELIHMWIDCGVFLREHFESAIIMADICRSYGRPISINHVFTLTALAVELRVGSIPPSRDEALQYGWTEEEYDRCLELAAIPEEAIENACRLATREGRKVTKSDIREAARQLGHTAQSADQKAEAADTMAAEASQ
jgi:hypothetical protein